MDHKDIEQSSVEDLTLTQEHAADVKGGSEIPMYFQAQTRNELGSGGEDILIADNFSFGVEREM